VYNSFLSEYGVLGFEYGFGMANPNTKKDKNPKMLKKEKINYSRNEPISDLKSPVEEKVMQPFTAFSDKARSKFPTNSHTPPTGVVRQKPQLSEHREKQISYGTKHRSNNRDKLEEQINPRPTEISSLPPLKNRNSDNLFYGNIARKNRVTTSNPLSQAYGKQRYGFPDFDKFQMVHDVKETPLADIVDDERVGDGYRKSLKHRRPHHNSEENHYFDIKDDYDYPYLKNNENEELYFDEMEHEAFAPPTDKYGPREPFGPPSSLLYTDEYTPEYRSLKEQYSEEPVFYSTHERLPKPQPLVKSLPQNFNSYSSYDTSYGHYQESGYLRSLEDHSEKPPHHPFKSHMEEQPFSTYHQELSGEQHYPSTLYSQNPPYGYDPGQQAYFHPQTTKYYPRTGLAETEWEKYGKKEREGRTIDDLPDHTTLRPFAYENLPLPPLTGRRGIDRTIQNIHKAFITGDSIGFPIKPDR
jgi:hypothetical protein